jgi:hypothetical protein
MGSAGGVAGPSFFTTLAFSCVTDKWTLTVNVAGGDPLACVFTFTSDDFDCCGGGTFREVSGPYFFDPVKDLPGQPTGTGTVVVDPGPFSEGDPKCPPPWCIPCGGSSSSSGSQSSSSQGSSSSAGSSSSGSESCPPCPCCGVESADPFTLDLSPFIDLGCSGAGEGGATLVDLFQDVTNCHWLGNLPGRSDTVTISWDCADNRFVLTIFPDLAGGGCSFVYARSGAGFRCNGSNTFDLIAGGRPGAPGSVTIFPGGTTATVTC